MYLGSPAMADFQIKLGYFIIIEVSLASPSLSLFMGKMVCGLCEG